MPTIDVTDVLISGDVAGQAFTVVRREERVNTHGRVEIVETRFPAVGSVTPTGDNSLVRQEAFSSQINSVQIVTTFRLRGAGKKGVDQQYQPDVVEWNGDRYLVRVVNDYTQFGAGMIQAECVGYDYGAQVPE